MGSLKKLLAVIAVFILLFGMLSHSASASSKYTYYVHKTAYLYSSTKSSKVKLKTIDINVKLTTYSKKTSSMFKVTYGGKTGYVYKSYLSTGTTAVTRYVKSASNLYTSTSSNKKKIASITVGTALTTRSPLSSTMYKVTYKGKTGYVYKSGLSSQKPAATGHAFGQSVRYGSLEVMVGLPENVDPYYAFQDDYSGVNNVVQFYVTVKNIGKDTQYVDGGTDLNLYSGSVYQHPYYPIYNDNTIMGTLHPGSMTSGYVYYETDPGLNLKLVFDNYQYDRNFNKIKAISFTGRN
ncbi:DUF4352 domain-containing protein [Bacillus sp. MUM 13]|uniref:DUF4352 domain-containing protein n=1 Tax=Bacillus sp. MUM 13 TaxID=1678001 RepID=UPI0008F57C69|nr:DUF4352 domain-containing protein [Bacillus sp. MUM 13]OIK08001.1 hypothetical protein BIV59_20680 [Bacillus sp. MUM 13]